ncbi:S1 RNA-binding domain-containing protein [Candidatus Endomicrobiellum trichonymphae]|uniref:S1 RNA-binding domain-containing protein n=1 Tax=Endomicrobium trichonymphae TaxID=1408204 RepID=UPI000BBB6425|nr:S1 RNA-binding domain-containing protein [Candidatus Endomicrobium trichonymphae]
MKKEVKEGQKIKVEIINVDKDKKISLSVREMFINHWDEAFRQNYSLGTVVRVVVQKKLCLLVCL